MVTIESVTKSYGDHRVLDDLTLSASAGEITLLVGANGCGKTTTMRVATGLSAPDSGRVLIAGHDLIGNPRQALANLSFLPQSPRFHADLSVEAILHFYARLRNLPASRVTAMAERWGLTASLRVRTGRLSGGMRQRLALAVLFLPQAPVILLDEPGLSLDPDWRRALQGELRRVAHEGTAVLVSTHLLGEWDDNADRCLVLENGRVGRELPPARLRDAFPFALPQLRRASAS